MDETQPLSSDTSRPAPSRSSLINLALGGTALLSAWLLFQVQPMVAKRILPWFGGGTAVWTTSMLFFQSALFLGYLYAHLTTRLAPRRQAILHILLLALAAGLAVVVGVLPDNVWKPAPQAFPVGAILLMLAACVGLPYLMLASTAPLMQVWFARINPGRSPYRLYALSNVGSMAALLTYPLLVEPRLGLLQQGWAWSAVFAGFAVLCAWCAAASLRSGIAAKAPGAGTANPPAADGARPTWMQSFFWIALPACASVALLAITNYICLDVAPIPLLWVAPLAVYLLSFILTFDSDRWYRRIVWMPLAAILSFAVAYILRANDTEQVGWLKTQVSLLLGLLLALSMVCHGELARMRPPARRLTAFYLCIAGGGALGGVFVGVVAPLVFSNYYEFPICIAATWLLAMAALATDRTSPLYDGKMFVGWLGIAGMLITVVVTFYSHAAHQARGTEAMRRGFYGVLRVKEYLSGTPDAYLNLTNGQISHGGQFRLDALRRVPRDYYYVSSAIGRLLQPQSQGAPRRVGVIGLGAGTLACYAEPGDQFRFHEINPQVIELADYHFTYLQDARDRGAEISIVEGDARLSLEREQPQEFDVLAVDAFNSDAIPAHLITLEAIELYLTHLKAAGVLAIHVTNEYLELEPVVKGAADRFKLNAAHIYTPADESPATNHCTWILLSRGELDLTKQPEARPLEGPAVVWTDDYSNLLGIIEN